MANTPIENLDFEEIKSEFVKFLGSQDKYKDYNFLGSNMNVLLDVLSYNTFYNQFYNNMALNEMFLDTAQLRNSVVSHAKALNYLPSSTRSAHAFVNLVITAEQQSNYFNIPKRTVFTAKCGDKTYPFTTDQSYTAVRTGDTQFTINGVKILEGRYVNELTTVDDLILKNNSADTTSIEVYVNDVQYTFQDDIFDVAADDTVFYLQAEDNGFYSIYFGNNTFGKQPLANDRISITYRVASGEEANGISSVGINSTNISGASSIVARLITTSAGGRNAEGIESIRRYAPKSIQVQNRAVTANDYKVILKRRFPNINDVSVFGGDKVSPPQYGAVLIAVDLVGGQRPSNTDLGQYRAFLSDKTPLTIEAIFTPAKYLYIDMDVKVVYNSKITSLNAEDMRVAIQNKILEVGESSFNGFNSSYLQSKLVKQVDNLDTSIVSVDITATPYLEYSPILNVIESPEFNFGNTLKKAYALNEELGFSNYEPAVFSSVLLIEDIQVQLQDDGNGNILATTVNVPDKTILKRNVGTVDYDTGIVRLTNFSVTGFFGSAIKLYGRTVSKNIFSEQDRNLEIRVSDISASVSPM